MKGQLSYQFLKEYYKFLNFFEYSSSTKFEQF